MNIIACLSECVKILACYQEGARKTEKEMRDALHAAEKELKRKKMRHAWSVLSDDQRQACQRSADMPSAVIACAQKNSKFISAMIPIQVTYDMTCAHTHDVYTDAIDTLALLTYELIKIITTMGQSS